MRRRGWSAGIALGMAWCAAVSGQRVAESPQRAAAAPILLNVQVTDKAGHPIQGLQQSDFTLLDEGKPVPIRFFRALSGSQPNTVSIALLIDDVNADFNEVTFARQQIAKFLRSFGPHLPAPVSVILMTETNLTRLLAPLTDGNRLAWELEQSEAHLRPVPATADWGDVERWQDSMQGLRKIIAYLARQPGRTLLVWIGPGWPLFDNPGNMVTDQAQRFWMRAIVDLSTGLRTAQVTLDTVDPEGPQDGAGLESSRWGAFLKPVKKPGDAWFGDLALQVLATESGGRVLYASNDAAAELSACAEDATAWYALSFDPQASDKPDRWHALEVKVDKPEVVVRTNNGYYAQPLP